MAQKSILIVGKISMRLLWLFLPPSLTWRRESPLDDLVSKRCKTVQLLPRGRLLLKLRELVFREKDGMKTHTKALILICILQSMPLLI
ncbi:hypothetical protein CEXT_351681 [Caerostris extrusa]|uniref:Uncharacterized protein n=1 Tax=Caerostris extrusa TaxID=172846 RepID=A0AAV4V8W1_CAEEX|nr:hypothetical protein CEXT_351681 [Caerostris extrusa]